MREWGRYLEDGAALRHSLWIPHPLAFRGGAATVKEVRLGSASPFPAHAGVFPDCSFRVVAGSSLPRNGVSM